MHTRGKLRVRPPIERVEQYIHDFRAHCWPLTINLLCYQDGSFEEADLALLKRAFMGG